MGWSESTSKEKTEIIKNGFDIFVKFTVTSLILACMIFPKFITVASEYTGIDIFSSTGVKPYDKKTDEKSIELQAKLDDNNNLLKNIEKNIANILVPNPLPAARTEVAQIQQSIATAVTGNSALLKSAAELTRQAPNTSRAMGTWAVLAGSDRKFEDTGSETRWMKQNGFSPYVYLRLGWYRTVVSFESREAAAAALPDIQRRRPDAYIIDFEKWCPNRTKGTDFDTCT
jgi:hypothetical protein